MYMDNVHDLNMTDRYLQRLKTICEDSLAKTLNPENAIKVMILANIYIS
ncbi:Protein of unknown function, partial [Cotesia congregata]